MAKLRDVHVKPVLIICWKVVMEKDLQEPKYLIKKVLQKI
jgi:hypothetical protein